jgi:hypothetical protein
LASSSTSSSVSIGFAFLLTISWVMLSYTQNLVETSGIRHTGHQLSLCLLTSRRS